MSTINEVVDAVIGLMNAAQSMATVKRGALPTGHGIVCEVGPSTPRLYMDKNTFVPLDITINGKHPNLRVLSDALNDIHARLTRAKVYPAGVGWQITDIKTTSLPQRIGREDNNNWLMASALSVEYYWRGE